MSCLSRDEAALLVIITPHLASHVEKYQDRFPKGASRSHERNEHYQLSGDVSLRINEHALQIRKSIETTLRWDSFLRDYSLEKPHDISSCC